jgi:hypothetical protein
MMKKCANCSWSAEEYDGRFCPKCGDNIVSDNVTSVKPEEPKANLDVNRDGKVDNADISIMAKAMGKRGGRPKGSKSKKRK